MYILNVVKNLKKPLKYCLKIVIIHFYAIMAEKVMLMIESYNRIYVEKSASAGAWEMVKMHAHNFHEMYFLVSGTRRYFIEDTLYDVAEGELVFIPQTKLHRTLPGGKGAHTRYVVYFEDAAVQSFIDKVGRAHYENLLQPKSIRLPEEISGQIRFNLMQMEQEQRDPDGYSHVVNTYLLENILLLALRHGTPKSPVTEKTVSKMQEVAHYINKNLSSPIGLQDAAKMAHMEATYFSKAFKAATGEGFQEYLTKVRLWKAEQLLEHSDLPVNRVAEACGFSTANYFSDVFRKKNGCSPSQYRKTVRNKSPHS